MSPAKKAGGTKKAATKKAAAKKVAAPAADAPVKISGAHKAKHDHGDGDFPHQAGVPPLENR